MRAHLPQAKVTANRTGERRNPALWLWCAMLLSLCLSSGCRGFTAIFVHNEAYDDFVLGWRDYTWARRAFNARKQQFANQPALQDFRNGFIDGYIEVANGGNGCTPAMPPRKYWTWKYQSSEGQTKVSAWYSGYPHGARAAEEEGAGNYHMIRVSPQLLEQFQRQDPDHPINRAFYENLPVPETNPYAPPQPLPTPQAAPPAGSWIEPEGSAVAPPTYDEGFVAPSGEQSGDDWSPRQLPPTEAGQAAPLPVVPPDEPGVGQQSASPLPPTSPAPLRFPITRIPTTQPAGWMEQPAPVATATPEPQPQHAIRQPWPSPMGTPWNNAPAVSSAPAMPAMLPPVIALPQQQQPTQPSSELQPPARLQLPDAPPALLQQPLGAPLFQSPDR